MEKEFIPYELALKLKQLGFDEPCLASWNLFTNELNYNGFPSTFQSEDVVQLPTYSQVFRWFREKYNIDACVQPFMRENNGTPFLPDESYGYWIFKDGVYVTDEVDFLNPEEAELACLEKLIEIVEQNKSE